MTDTPDRLREKAEALVSDWLAADPKSDIGMAGRGWLVERIAAFAHAEREAALREAEKAAEASMNHNVYLESPHTIMCLGCRAIVAIRALRPAGGEK